MKIIRRIINNSENVYFGYQRKNSGKAKRKPYLLHSLLLINIIVVTVIVIINIIIISILNREMLASIPFNSSLAIVILLIITNSKYCIFNSSNNPLIQESIKIIFYIIII